MPEIKNTFTQGKMNKDLDERIIPNGQYIDALNIQVSTSEDSDVGTAQNIIGNTEITSNFIPRSGTLYESVGVIADEQNNKIYSFITNDTTSAIIEYTEDTISGTYSSLPVIVDTDNSRLQFSIGDIITGINIIDNILLWTDNNTEPKKINIDQFKINLHADLNTTSNFYVDGVSTGTFKEEHITVIKKRPTQAPIIELIKSGDETGSVGTTNLFSMDSVQVGDLVNFSVSLDTYLFSTSGNSWTPYHPDPYEDVAGNLYDEATHVLGGGCDIYDAYPLNINVGDILLLSDPTAQGVLPQNAQIRFLVTLVSISLDDNQAGCDTGFTQVLQGTILHIDSDTSLDSIEYNFVVEDLENLLFSKSFPRFSYRYKYQDGEYSAFGPFTQVGFAPGEFSIHPTREPYNSAMDNRIKQVIIKEFVTHDIPDGVVEIDLLYKPDDSNMVYTIDTIKPTQDEWTQVDADGFTKYYNLQLPSDIARTTIPSNTGYYKIDHENIYAAIESKQLLRPWDNVPKIAKSQEIVANRLVYGNYEENLNLQQFDPSIVLRYEDRDFANKVIDFTRGQESIKSQRTYQAGVVIGDKYGRETPVFTSKNGSITIPYDADASAVFEGNASKSNRLYFKQYLNTLPINATGTSAVSTLGLDEDPYYFKVFIKQTASEYYNLITDRVYRAEEDGNLWVSLPSSDRNKVKEDDFIILKKGLGVGNTPVGQVEIENKYKIIDIKNEAPDFIKSKYLQIGELDGNGNLSDLYHIPTNQPFEGATTLILSKDSFLDENLSDIQEDYNRGVKYSITFTKTLTSGNIINSKRYNIITLITTAGTPDYYTLILSKPIVSTDAWVESSTGTLETSLKTQIWKEENQEWEEFQGRFFIKILSDIVTDQYLEPQIGAVSTYSLAARKGIHYVGNLRSPNTSTQGLFQGSTATYGLTGPHNTNSNLSNTLEEWRDEALHFENGIEGTGWFIDQAFAKSYQPTIVSDTSNSSHWSNPNVGLFPEFDVSTSWHLRKGKGSNGLMGVYEQDNLTSHPSSSLLAWAHQKPEWTAFKDTSVYGETSSPGGRYFMHLSFSGVGDPLFVGSGDRAGFNVAGVSSDGDTPSSWDIQSIVHHNQGPKFQTGSLGYGILTADVGPWTQNNSSFIPTIENQWNPVYNKPENEEIVKNLVSGNKFRFSHDINETVFTIKNVSIKRIYNHTSWNPTYYWNDVDQEFLFDLDDTRSVYARFRTWWNNGKLLTDLDDFLQTIKDFAQPHNRRVCYILELDKNPEIEVTDGTLTGIQAVLDALPGNDDLSDGGDQTPTFMEFYREYVSENSTVLSDDPAIWETEPKENTELDVYYEASNAMPLTLDVNSTSAISISAPAPDDRKGYMIGKIGEAVRCNDATAHLSTPDFGDCVVKSWDGNIVELDPGLNINTNYTTDEAGQSNWLVDKVLKFYKEDLSYIELGIFSVPSGGISVNNFITKLALDRELSNKKIGLSYFDCYSFGNGVESNRIRDDFNKPFISNGVKASTTLKEQYKVENRKSGLIYSGLYNSVNGINDLNQFIMAEKITKDLLPTYGSIQKLYTRNQDLVAFCEDQVVQIFADKDVLYNADGKPQLISSNAVLGESRPFVGDYGISKNPESFARDTYRAYFTDTQRGAVLRLSMDGLTPISEAGMTDYFKDNLRGTLNLIGSFDIYKKQYNLTIDRGSKTHTRGGGLNSSDTISFSEEVKGWVSFKSFIQEQGVSMGGNYYTFYNGFCYLHDYSGIINAIPPRNTFYGVPYDSTITAIINAEPSTIKTFHTLNYEGDGDYTITNHPDDIDDNGIPNSVLPSFNGWNCELIETNEEEGTIDDFIKKESKYFNYIKGIEMNLTETSLDVDSDTFNIQGLGRAVSIVEE